MEKRILFRPPIAGALVFLLALTAFFSFGFGKLDLSLVDPEFFHYYPAMREWFLRRLLSGELPAWNPYWGIGHAAESDGTVPLDLFSLFEMLGAGAGLIRPLQLFTVLLVAVAGLRALGLRVAGACVAATAFIASPWVLYQFFFFPSVNAYLGALAGAPLTYLWMVGGDRRVWLALALTFFLTFFGLRPEHWVFNLTFFALVAVATAATTRSTKHLGGFALALGLAVTAHAWQIVPLVQVARDSHPHLGVGLTALLTSEMYVKLARSVWDSLLIKILALSLSLWLLTGETLWRQALGSLGVVLLFFTAEPFALANSFGAGALIGGAAWIHYAKPRRREILRVLALFLPLAYYWNRSGEGDLGEIAVMNVAPSLLRIFFGFLTWQGAVAARSARAGAVFFVVFLTLFFIRDQGQIVSAYLTGLTWAPTHDNYLFDFSLAVLAGLGLAALPARAVPALLAVAMVALAPNPFYSLPSQKLDPQSLSHYARPSGGESALRELRDSASWRGYFTRPGGLETDSLRVSANEVTLQSALGPSRFRDWTLYQRLGIPPHVHWSSYPAGYTKETIDKLPAKDFFVYSNDIASWWGRHAWLPNNPNLFRLLGVKHVLSGEPLPPSPDYTDHRRVGELYSARLIEPMPRAFLVPRLEGHELAAFREDLSPLAGVGKLRAGGKVMPFKRAAILSYEPNRIVIESQSEGKTILVLTDLFHPFWRARVDDEDAPLFPALYLFRGIALPGGRHTVTFECRIPYFAAAITASCLALFLILMRGLRWRWPRDLRSRLGRPRSWRDPLGAYRNAGSSAA